MNQSNRRKKSFIGKVTIISIFVSLIFLGMTQTLNSIELCPQILHSIEQGYFSKHIKYHKAEPFMVKRVNEQLIKKFDPSKLYLLKSDVDNFKKSMANLFKMSGEEKYKAILDLKNILLKRMKIRLEHIKKYLGKDFKIDKETTFVLDAKKRKFPTTCDEADKNIEKFVQFQISNYIISGEKLEAAKKYVIKNYERSIKNIKDLDENDLLSFYLDSFANSFDPHTNFFSKDVLEDFEINMKLSLEGIGALLREKDGFTEIIQLIDGGAAKKSGKLKPKDKIIEVAQGDAKPVNVIDMELRNVVKLIRGKAGSEVRLTILRNVDGKNIRFIVPLKRTKVNLEDRAAKMYYFDRKVGDKTIEIGLLSLPSFYSDMSFFGGRSCANDTKKLLAEARKKKVDAIVLDLSTNGGGSLSDAVRIAGQFFRTGNVVKQSTTNGIGHEITLRDVDPTVDFAGPLVVLTSRSSASASEIVSGTLQDYKRAIIVGDNHTFGKGSVQTIISMGKDIGALKVTIGMYYIPGGNSTQLIGVNPEIKLPSSYVSEEIGEKTMDYPLPATSIKSFLSPDAYVTSGVGKWDRVNKMIVEKLAQNSKLRVAQNKEFQKIIKQYNIDKKNGGVIKLATQWKRKVEAKAEGKDADRIMTQKEIEDQYLKRPDILEAIDIARDYAALKMGLKLPKVEKKVEKKGEKVESKLIKKEKSSDKK